MNNAKRTTLKTLAVSGVSAALPVTAFAAASQFSCATGCQIRIEHDPSQSHDRVVIENHTDEMVVIDQISPLTMQTPDTSIHMAVATGDGPLMLPPQSELGFDIHTRVTGKRGQLQAAYIPHVVAQQLKVVSSHPAMLNLSPKVVFV